MKTLFFSQKSKQWIFSIALIIGAFASAQSQSKFTVGARAGANISSYSGLESVKPQLGVTGGIFMQYKPWKKFGLSADLLYAQFNTHYVVEDKGAKFTEKLNMDYLELPLLVNYYLGKGTGKVFPRIMLGPNLSYLLEGKFTGVGAAPRGTFKEMDLGLLAGVGANCIIGDRMWLTTDLRYMHSFTDMLEAGSISATNKAVMNRNVSFTIGIGIGIGKTVANSDNIQ